MPNPYEPPGPSSNPTTLWDSTVVIQIASFCQIAGFIVGLFAWKLALPVVIFGVPLRTFIKSAVVAIFVVAFFTVVVCSLQKSDWSAAFKAANIGVHLFLLLMAVFVTFVFMV